MNNYARVMVYLSTYTIYRLRYMTREMIDYIMMTSSIQIEGSIDEKIRNENPIFYASLRIV